MVDIYRACAQRWWLAAWGRCRHDLAYRALVTVQFVPVHINMLAKHQGRQVLLGALTKSLIVLGCINTGQPNLVGALGGIQHSQGVAICDAHHLALQQVGASGQGTPKCQQASDAQAVHGP